MSLSLNLQLVQPEAGWLCFPWDGQVDFCALSIYRVYIKARVSRREFNFCNLNSKERQLEGMENTPSSYTIWEKGE